MNSKFPNMTKSLNRRIGKMVLPKRKWKSNWWQYHDAISSRANNTPPTGARKAAAIPAADPHVTRSRRSRSFLKYRNHLHVNPYFFDPPWPINAATHAPVCTMGPALPVWRDDDTAQMLPTICKSTRINTRHQTIKQESPCASIR